MSLKLIAKPEAWSNTAHYAPEPLLQFVVYPAVSYLGQTYYLNGSRIPTIGEIPSTSSAWTDYDTGGGGGGVSNVAWTAADASGTSLTLTTNYATYSSANNLIVFTSSITYPVTANVSNAIISGLPVTANSPQLLQGVTSNGIEIIAKITGANISLFDVQNIALRNVDISGLTIFLSGSFQS